MKSSILNMLARDQVGDVFTKGVFGPRLRSLLLKLGVVKRGSVNEGEKNTEKDAANAA